MFLSQYLKQQGIDFPKILYAPKVKTEPLNSWGHRKRGYMTPQKVGTPRKWIMVSQNLGTPKKWVLVGQKMGTPKKWVRDPLKIRVCEQVARVPSFCDVLGSPGACVRVCVCVCACVRACVPACVSE
jgi:hypothetical protein